MQTKTIVSTLILAASVLAACTAAPAAPGTGGAAQTAPPATAAPATEAPATAVPATEAPTAEPTKAPEPTAAAAVTGTTAMTATTAVTTTAATTTTTAAAPAMPAVKNTLTITLRKGLKWSDGSDVTSKDLVGNYNIIWAQGGSTWAYLADVVAKDAQTVDFLISNPSPRALRLILSSNNVLPYSVYGKFMDQAADFRKNNVKLDSDAVKKFVDALTAFKPDKPVVAGPMVVDPASVTEAQLEMVKNPSGYNADKVGFDKLTVYFGETQQVMPFILSNDQDYSSNAYTPANIKAINDNGAYQIIGGPTGTGPGIWFNESVKPLDNADVRRAFAYVIDRTENAQVALGIAAKPLKYMAGFTDLAVESWLSKDQIAKLNPYNKDLAKAEALLSGAGYKKGGDGVFADGAGKKLEFELAVPSDFSDWFGSAENAAQQLTKFGIKTTVRGYPSAERGQLRKEAKYQLLMDLSIRYNYPHPVASFDYYMGKAYNSPDVDGTSKGYNFPVQQKGMDGKEVSYRDLIAAASTGFDKAPQQDAIANLAYIVNDQLPVLALFERYATDPIDGKTRVTGWLPLDNKLYLNNQGDNYVMYQFINGGLKPSGDVKEFKSSYPFVQPPKGNFNKFSDDYMDLGSMMEPLQFPPLFFYMWTDGKYEPMLAEKYEIK